MLNKSKMIRFLSLSVAIAGFVLVSGHFSQTNAQVDPFKQPEWKKTKKPTTVSTPGAVKPTKPVPPAIVAVAAPAIEQRINYYKQMRETAVSSGMAVPKVTSVLTLDEMAVTGIFKTSRGYAAMVEATPIKLSYTIYPGEKFFDGQLVAIEENRLVFRKVVKMSNNKFISSVENKGLRQFTIQQEVQAPAEITSAGKTEVANNNAATPTTTTTATVAPTEEKPKTSAPTVIISPVDEMNKQPESKPEDSVKDKNNKKNKKTVKVAKKS
jgi:hypothetical protein